MLLEMPNDCMSNGVDPQISIDEPNGVLEVASILIPTTTSLYRLFYNFRR